MYGFPLDHLQGFVIILDCYMCAINVCIELLKIIANREAFPLYVCVPSFNIRAKVFLKLDAKDRFWSVHLDTPSSFLTTFNTHKGCYQFLHMPFGLKMSQDVFQMVMDQITDRLPGIIAIHGDICV